MIPDPLRPGRRLTIRQWRRRVLAALALVVIVPTIAGFAAGRASAAPVPAPAVAQGAMTDTVEWLAAELRVPLQVPPLTSATPRDLASTDSIGEAWTEQVRVRPWVVRQLHLIGAGRPGWWWPSALHVATHEALHYACADCRRTEAEAWVDEGLVEAVTRDVLPAASFQLFGLRPERGFNGYPGRVAAVRALSARATGSRTWRARAARAWRKAALVGPADVRAAMIAEASR